MNTKRPSPDTRTSSRRDNAAREIGIKVAIALASILLTIVTFWGAGMLAGWLWSMRSGFTDNWRMIAPVGAGLLSLVLAVRVILRLRAKHRARPPGSGAKPRG